jgi:hypothetical protein
MIKKYNQFVKENKTNEEFEMDAPVAMPRTAPATPDVKPDVTEKPSTEPTKPSPFRRDKPSVEPNPKAEVEMEDEEIGLDKYTAALQSLADAAGVEYNPEDKSVTINGKKVIFPTETEKYHVEGVKKPFATAEEVISYFNSDSRASNTTTQSQEVPSIKDEEALEEEPSFEETEGELAKRDLEDEMGKFESKSYRNTRLKKFRK